MELVSALARARETTPSDAKKLQVHERPAVVGKTKKRARRGRKPFSLVGLLPGTWGSRFGDLDFCAAERENTQVHGRVAVGRKRRNRPRARAWGRILFSLADLLRGTLCRNFRF